jgi:DNA ligase-1
MSLETKRFEPLFGKSKNNKMKTWSIFVERFQDYSEIVTRHGYVDAESSIIESRRRVSKGKNIGKSNETTHYEQAILEAKSKWTQKSTENLERVSTETPNKSELSSESLPVAHVSVVHDHSSPVNGPVNGSGNPNLKIHSVGQAHFWASPQCVPRLPMLAHDYSKHKKKLKFPCYIQPKLDGYRMIFDTTTKTITTRQGKDLPIVKESGAGAGGCAEHYDLYKELISLPSGYILDGELYVHGSEVSFEALGVLRKTKKLSEDDKKNLSKIQYHVYDMIDTKINFEKRSLMLRELIHDKYKMIQFVQTLKLDSEKEIQPIHESFTKQGYEGTMLRNSDSLYLEKNRSHDLLKYKDFMDEEFEIVGYSFEKDTSGEDRNCIVWIVKVKEGVLCNVRPKGPKEQRQQLYEQCEKDFSKYKGRKLWTKFFDYTGDGSLRFPSTKTEDVKSYIRDEVL